MHPYVTQLDAAATISNANGASVSYTIHACRNLLQQANVYANEQQYEHAYVMYKRSIKYYFENVSKHRDFSTCSQTEKQAFRARVDQSIDRLADITMLLNDKYHEVDKQYAEELERQKRKPSPAPVKPQGEQQPQIQPVIQTPPSPVELVPSSAEDIDLEARLRRLMASDDESQSIELPPPDFSHTSVNSSPSTSPISSYPSDVNHSTQSFAPSSDVSVDESSQAFVPSAPEESSSSDILPDSSASSNFIPQHDLNPPMPIPNPNKWSNLRMQPETKLEPVRSLDTLPKPSLQPEPIRAAGVPQYSYQPQLQAPANPSTGQSFVERMFGQQQNLRNLIIPASLMMQFMQNAMVNTMNNLETCAVLCGKLKENQLIVTHCIFPPQNATADTCVTHDEEALLNVQTKLDLLTLGWIHTHPSQSCFLSSIDLHTQYTYQLMMPESVAIVCAPSQAAAQKHEGIFSINQRGMKLLSNCRLTGFHQHAGCEDGDLYGDAQHVRMDPRLVCELIDLRRPQSSPAPHRHPHQHQPQYINQPLRPHIMHNPGYPRR